MASKYLQKYPVPEGFQEILHDFTKEVLRAQSDDIIEFAYNYFDHKARGLEYKVQSRFNIDPTGREKKNYDKVPYEQIGRQAEQVVSGSNQDTRQDRAISGISQQQSVTTHGEEKNLTKEFMGGLYGNAVQDVVGGGGQSHQNSNHQESIQQSDQSQITHREEKNLAKEFSSNIYEKAIDNVEGGEVQEQKKEEVVLDGPIEEYENAALMIQKNFRSKQKNK